MNYETNDEIPEDVYDGRDSEDPIVGPYPGQIASPSETLGGFAQRIMKGLPHNLHRYRPLIISAVVRIVPSHNRIDGVMDAAKFLDEAYRSWQEAGREYSAKQFSAYAKKCVTGRLRNAYVRSVMRPRRPEPDLYEETLISWAAREEQRSQMFVKMLEPAMVRRPDVIAQLRRFAERKGFRRDDLKKVRRHVFDLLPDVEQYAIDRRTAGQTGRDIADELGVSPGRVTQIQQEAIERALVYMAEVIGGTAREDLARRTAERELMADARFARRSPHDRAEMTKIRTWQILHTSYITHDRGARRFDRWRVRRFYWEAPRGRYWTGGGSWGEPAKFRDVFTFSRPRYPTIADGGLDIDYADDFDDYGPDDPIADEWQRAEIVEMYYSNAPG